MTHPARPSEQAAGLRLINIGPPSGIVQKGKGVRGKRPGGPGRPKNVSGGLALGRKRLTAQVVDGLFLLRVPVIRQATVDRHVRLDPLAMPFLPRRGQVLAGGQIEAVAVLERQEPANRPITPGALSENPRAEIVTQR